MGAVSGPGSHNVQTRVRTRSHRTVILYYNDTPERLRWAPVGQVSELKLATTNLVYRLFLRSMGRHRSRPVSYSKWRSTTLVMQPALARNCASPSGSFRLCRVLGLPLSSSPALQALS